MTKQQLIEKIKLRLGYPMIKIELTDAQILECIDEARSKFIEWAVGNATQEVWFTVMLSGGQSIYDLPIGVTEVIDYSVDTGLGKINSLFTIENYFYSHGYYEWIGGPGVAGSAPDHFSLLSYHIARDFLATIERYTVDEYNYKYHKYTNQLEIQPIPKCGNSFTPTGTDCDGNVITYATVDSPGFILLHTMMIQGSTLPNYNPNDNEDSLYNEDWIRDYATALSMRILGLIRRKFENTTSLGNTSLSLDGSTMYSDALEWLEKLKEEVKNEKPHLGFPIIIG